MYAVVCLPGCVSEFVSSPWMRAEQKQTLKQSEEKVENVRS